MRNPLIIGTVLATIIIFFLNSMMNSALGADTNTVSSTVVTNNTPPTASAPSVVVNNSDICKTATSGAVQTQILGIATGVTITDENCERIKLSRSLYGMGMKVAAVSILCQDVRVFDSMWSAGTFCPSPISSKIGIEAKQEWLDNKHLIPEGSFLLNEKEITKQEREANDELTKFIFMAMAMYIGFPIFF